MHMSNNVFYKSLSLVILTMWIQSRSNEGGANLAEAQLCQLGPRW